MNTQPVTAWDDLPLVLRKEHVAQVLGIGERTAQRYLSDLLDEGVAMRVGKSLTIGRERLRSLVEGSGRALLLPDSDPQPEVAS